MGSYVSSHLNFASKQEKEDLFSFGKRDVNFKALFLTFKAINRVMSAVLKFQSSSMSVIFQNHVLTKDFS